MLVQECRVDLLVSRLETTAGHVSLPHALNLLNAELITIEVKLIINRVKKLDQFLRMVSLRYRIEIMDVYKYDRTFTLFISEILLAI